MHYRICYLYPEEKKVVVVEEKKWFNRNFLDVKEKQHAYEAKTKILIEKAKNEERKNQRNEGETEEENVFGVKERNVDD